MIVSASSRDLCSFTLLFYAIFSLGIAAAQSPPPSEILHSIGFTSSVPPAYKYSQNMAILDRFPVDTYTDRFEYFVFDSKNFLVVKEKPSTGPAGFVFYNVTEPSQPIRIGKINIRTNYDPSDMEVVSYNDTIRLFLYTPRNNDSLVVDIFLDVRVTTDLMDALLTSPNVIDTSAYFNSGIIERQDSTAGVSYEMIYYHDGRLFFATNLDFLRYIDVSTPSTWIAESDIILFPDTTGTLHKQVKNHEVKAFTSANGDRVVGVGAVRSGMRLLTFDQSWTLDSTVAQYYDHDRALLPSTIINSNKILFDPTVHQPVTDVRNNKWDHRVCHSVLPYDHNGRSYVLTVDEFTKSDAAQNENGAWIPEFWEGIDFFEPNAVDTSTEQLYYAYYNGMPLYWEDGSPQYRVGWSGFKEVDTLRLNFNHRNHPKHRGVDPMRIQGAFLRI